MTGEPGSHSHHDNNRAGGIDGGGDTGGASAGEPGQSGRAGGYRTILADPPWDVQQRGARGASEHYDLLSLAQIAALPVGELAAEDAHLWLWVTNATLRHGYDIAEAWGFTVRSPLTWIKFRLGLGNYLRNATEHLLFATRGRAPVGFRAQPTWMQAPVQDHSHKPEEQYALIERISPGPYLELFARRRPPSRATWHVWGDQIASDIVVPGYPVPSDTQLLSQEGAHPAPNPTVMPAPGQAPDTWPDVRPAPARISAPEAGRL